MAKNNGKGTLVAQPEPGHAKPMVWAKRKRDRRVPVDQRTRPARRWRALYQHYLAQAPRHEQLVRTLASLIVEREKLDAALGRGEAVDPDHLIRLAGAISRVFTKIGIARQPTKLDRLIQAVREAHPT